jgi:hypothetical protein
MNILQSLRFVLPLLVLTVLSSCSSEFRSAWKKAAVTEGVDGKWVGTWLSAANGHHGKLRCFVSCDPDAQPYTCGAGVPLNSILRTFFYHATWKSILSGSYKAVHNVQKQKDGSYSFKGDHQMPDWAGGKYHYEGTIKGDDFNACYESAMDRGTYTMKRVR